MGCYWDIIKKTKLQEWPYSEMKLASNKEIEQWYKNGGWKGTSFKLQQNEVRAQNETYRQIGGGLIGIAFGYLIMWMIMILFGIFIFYKIAHHIGGS